MAKKTDTAAAPTSYAEINRMHRISFGNFKGTAVITSAKNGEGASTFAHTMALKSAESGKNTLLIDLNMRTLSITQSMELKRFDWDLPSIKTTLPKKLLQTKKSIAKLSVLSAPTDVASIEYLKDPQNVETFFKLAEKQFDHVIVDTTPVGTLNRYNADPVLLASAARKTILVSMAGVTPKDRIRKAITQLEESGVKPSGIVINDKHNPSMKESLLEFIGGLQKVSPGLHSWLRKKILAEKSLN